MKLNIKKILKEVKASTKEMTGEERDEIIYGPVLAQYLKEKKDDKTTKA